MQRRLLHVINPMRICHGITAALAGWKPTGANANECESILRASSPPAPPLMTLDINYNHPGSQLVHHRKFHDVLKLCGV
jgi:hypothetical protein